MSTAVRLVGSSPVHRSLLERLARFAQTDAEILITGPTGVGKELYAQYTHRQSPRAQAPFVPVNCGAIPDSLLENELFGHVGGAFTGAKPQSEGVVAAAEGGTLFLDEIDTLSAPAQVKLLRFIQEKEYRRLGESRTRRANIRFIAATNQDLVAAVQAVASPLARRPDSPPALRTSAKAGTAFRSRTRRARVPPASKARG